MKYAVAAALISSAAAQGFGGPGRGQAGGYPGLPSCLSSCFTSNTGCNFGDISCYCNNTSVNNINSCIGGTSCSTTDKNGAYQAIAQLCVNNGATVTATQEATFSATSGMVTTALLLSSSDLAGGTLWPTQWTSNADYAAAWSSWKTQTTGAPFGGAWGAGNPGWNGGNGYGPFGGPGNGWGPWASDHTGGWTTGPWTRWWGTGACPPTTWSGWTSGPWTSTCSWTSWTACTASTTATSVITTTVTTSGTTAAITTTAYAVQVAEVASTSSPTTGGAQPTNYGVAGAAAGVIGLLAGAVLL